MNNHCNLRIIVNNRDLHPFAVKHRLQFFARQAGKRLIIEQSTQQNTSYQVQRG